MTTKDKTGDQLMASIRKTKTEGATPDKGTTGAPQAAPATAKAAAPKARPATAGTGAKRPRVAKKQVAAKPNPAPATAGAEVSGYQSPGRVWPD